MTDAIGALHVIEQLTTLANQAPGPNAQALTSVREALNTVGLNNGATGYKAEKLQAVLRDFTTRFGPQAPFAAAEPATPPISLLRDIEHLKKVLARWSEGQD